MASEAGVEACPCCGAQTLTKRGYHEICRACMWEDDPGQRDEPDSDMGANGLSLNKARENYRTLGTSDPRFAKPASPG